jgi:hypothetical protein
MVMKFDFSYLELVYDVISGNKDVVDIIKTKTYEAIKSHGENSFGGHNNIIKAINSINDGEPNKLAKHLLDNKEKIFNLVKTFKEREEEFITTIIKNVKNIYPYGDFRNITIFLIVGYDAIGYRGDVICSIDFNFVLEDYRELVSLLIHETAHVIHAQYCSAINNITLKKEDIKETLNMLIQSEGIAIFSAYNYRRTMGILDNKDGIIREDYINTIEKELILREAYRDTMKYIKENKSINIILNRFFTVRVDHALGFIIFENMYKDFGIDIIREMALIKNSDFVKLYL